MKEIITVLTSEYSILSAIPVSRLDSTNLSIELSDYNYENYKFLVSEPNHDIATKHISKFVSLDDMEYKIKYDIGIYDILEDIEKLKETKSDNRPTELSDYGMKIELNIENPSIISSFNETLNGNISSVGVYDLSDGMDKVFEKIIFDVISTNNIYSDYGHFNNLSSNYGYFNRLNSNYGYFNRLNSNNLSSNYGYFNNLSSKNLSSFYGYFNNIEVKNITISGETLSPLRFMGKGIYISENELSDIGRGKIISAIGHNGWLYQIDEIESLGLNDVEFASNGEKWVLLGPMYPKLSIDTESLTDFDTHVPSSKLMKTELESIKNKIDAQLNKLNKIV